MAMDNLAQHIESLIFTAEAPISFAEIKSCLQACFDKKFKKPALEKILTQLVEKYQQEDFSFELVEIAGGYQFLTKAAYHTTVGVYLKQTTKKRLSRAALETLSIIAYKQPVAKSEMEKIRGVSCDYSVHKLLEKELVTIVGRSEGPGKALLYGTSEKFMDYFGLKNITDLPKPKDFKEPDNEIGEKAPIDEDAPVAETPPNAPVGETANRPSATDDTSKSARELPKTIEQDNQDIPTEISEEEVVGEATQPKEESNTAENDNKTSLDIEEAVIATVAKEKTAIDNLQDLEKMDAASGSISEEVGQQPTDNTKISSTEVIEIIEEPTFLSEDTPKETVTAALEDLEKQDTPNVPTEILEEEVQGEATQPKEVSPTAENKDKTSSDIEEAAIPKVAEKKITTDIQDFEKLDSAEESISEEVDQQPVDNIQTDSIEAEIIAEPSTVSEEISQKEAIKEVRNVEKLEEIIKEEEDIDENEDV